MNQLEIDKLISELSESFESSDWESLSTTCDMLDAIGSIIAEQRHLRRKEGKTDLKSVLKFLAQPGDSELTSAAESVSFIETVADGTNYFGVTMPPEEEELDEAGQKLVELLPVLKRLLEGA